MVKAPAAASFCRQPTVRAAMMIIFIILFGLLNAVTHILSMMDLLPVYR